MYWYQKSTIAIENNATQSSIRYVQQLNHHLDYYFSNLERTTIPIFTDPLIQQLINVDAEDQYEQFSLRRQIATELLSNVRLSRPDISGFSIVLNDGSKVTSYGTTSNQTYSEEDLHGKNYTIMGIGNQEEPLLTIARRLIDTKTYESTGILLIYINLNQLTKIISGVHLGESGNISIVNANGLILYHQHKEKIGSFISNDKLHQFLKEPNGSFINENNRDKNIITYLRLQKYQKGAND
ncbi:cache domain-containing protein [Bacillus sp. N9]